MNTVQLITDGIELTEEFAPTAVKLIKDLFSSLAGKTEEQVLADAETNFAAIHAKAVAEQQPTTGTPIIVPPVVDAGTN